MIHLISVGQRQEAWVKQGYENYAKRLRGHCQLKLHEIALPNRGKRPDIKRLQQKEGDAMLAAVPKGAHVIALDEHGKQWNNPELAKQLDNWLQGGKPIALFIGGPDGLAPACLERANQRWSLSNLVLPHPLVRIVVAEQLYRAWSLLNNHPYHRA